MTGRRRRRAPRAPRPPVIPPRRLPLGAVAGWEAAILASIAGASGPPEVRDAQIARSGLYGEYPEILAAYQTLFADPASADEAIRRATFIAWVAGVRPACDTAVRELPERAVRTTVGALEALLQRGGGDPELRWMLAWYHGTAPWLFHLYGTSTAVDDFVRDVPPEAWRQVAVDPASLANRGQMGQYWRALLDGRRLPAAVGTPD